MQWLRDITPDPEEISLILGTTLMVGLALFFLYLLRNI